MVGLCRWQVFWCDPAGSSAEVVDDPVLAGLPSLSEWARQHGTRSGQPFLLRTDGHGVPEVDEFFASPRMRSCKQGTLRKYAFTLATWMGFLDAIEYCWRVQVLADDRCCKPVTGCMWHRQIGSGRDQHVLRVGTSHLWCDESGTAHGSPRSPPQRNSYRGVSGASARGA